MANIHVDVSEHQGRPIDSSYDLPFFMFRLVNEFGNIDALAPENLRRSVAMRQQGKLVNFGGYCNPGHASNASFLAAISQLGFPHDAVLMLDAEPWPQPNGQPLISGDHSGVFNELATKLRARQGGRADLAWGYLSYFGTALWTQRPAWLGMITPWYQRSVKPPDYGHMIGWQYTDGAPGKNGTAARESTPPFGRVDHNVMFIDYPTPGGDMALDADTKAYFDRQFDEQQAQISALKTQLFAGLATQDQVHSLAVQSAARDGGDPTAVAEAVVARIGQVLQGASQ